MSKLEDDRVRMLLRIGAVGIAYIVYRALAERHAAGALLTAGGVLMLDWFTIDRLTLRRRARLELLDAANLVLASGLLALGIFLVV